MFMLRASGGGFAASGMNKSGTQSTPGSQNTWALVTAWTADTATYPGSSVTSNALIAQGTAAGRTISAQITWTAGSFGNTIQVRIKQNGTVIATGSASTSSPSIASTTASVASADQFTVEVEDTSSLGPGSPATITAGSSTYLHII